MHASEEAGFAAVQYVACSCTQASEVHAPCSSSYRRTPCVRQLSVAGRHAQLQRRHGRHTSCTLASIVLAAMLCVPHALAHTPNNGWHGWGGWGFNQSMGPGSSDQPSPGAGSTSHSSPPPPPPRSLPQSPRSLPPPSPRPPPPRSPPPISR